MARQYREKKLKEIESKMMSKDECIRTLTETIRDYIIPFWLDKSVDKEYGGYLTSFDEKGEFDGNGIKNIVTQARMVWGFSNLLEYAKEEDKPRMAEAAKQGAEYLMNEFWDKEYGGWYWLLNRDSSIADPAKLTYGEGFAIYALSEYYLVYKDERALEFACKGFDLLQKYAADTLYGGYYENIERNWELSPAGKMAGDRKSLDIHMHLLETFTTLYKASGLEIHKRKLQEVYDLIVAHMMNTKDGYGFNQFDIRWNKIPAVNIPRTWNAERESSEKIDTPTDTTSYGHNVEFTWLADLALRTMGSETDADRDLFRKILDHSLAHGYDHENGGMFRDGVGCGPALVTDKEWWQNFESMTGYLNGYTLYGDERYFDAFIGLWEFNRKYFMNYEVGESRQLLKKDGTPIIANMGNPWKGIYHTGRAFAECLRRLTTI